MWDRKVIQLPDGTTADAAILVNPDTGVPYSTTSVTNGVEGSNTTVSTLYKATAGFVDQNGTTAIGNSIRDIQVLNPAGTVISDIWSNLTANFVYAVPPPGASIAVESSNPLTLSQLQTLLPLSVRGTTGTDQVALDSSIKAVELAVRAQGGGIAVMDANNAVWWMDVNDEAVPKTVTYYQFGTTNTGSPVLPVRPYSYTVGAVDVTNSVLPTGAATSANQALQLTQETTAATKLNAIELKTPALGTALSSASTPVVLASDSTLPLPTGAATSALQTSQSTILSNTLTQLTTVATRTPALGVALAVASSPVVLASDAVLPLPTGAATAAAQATQLTQLTTIASRTPALGTALAAASTPVVLASDATLPLPTGAGTAANQSLQLAQETTAATKLTSIEAKTPALGISLAAAASPVVLASDAVLPLPTGAATSAAQATQLTQLTAISGKLPVALGAQTKANSLAVNIASDQTVPVSVAAVQRTSALTSSTGSGSTTAGLYAVSFNNIGNAAATVAGGSLPAGQSLTFQGAMNDTLAAITYNATGTTLLVATLT